MKPILVVQGAQAIDDVPRLIELEQAAEIRFATSVDELRQALTGAEVMLGWNFRADSLRQAWGSADSLRWIHWGGAGVDAAGALEIRWSRGTAVSRFHPGWLYAHDYSNPRVSDEFGIEPESWDADSCPEPPSFNGAAMPIDFIFARNLSARVLGSSF